MSQLILNNNTTSPDAGAAGKIKIYTKTDLALYMKDHAGTETLLSAVAVAGGGTELRLESPDGSMWAIRITNVGSLTRTLLP